MAFIPCWERSEAAVELQRLTCMLIVLTDVPWHDAMLSILSQALRAQHQSCTLLYAFGFFIDGGDEVAFHWTSPILCSSTVALFLWWKKQDVTLEEVGQLIYSTSPHHHPHTHILHYYPLTRSFPKWSPWRVSSQFPNHFLGGGSDAVIWGLLVFWMLSPVQYN